MIREAVGFYLSVGRHDSDPLLQIYLVNCLNPHTVTSSENSLGTGEMWLKNAGVLQNNRVRPLQVCHTSMSNVCIKILFPNPSFPGDHLRVAV